MSGSGTAVASIRWRAQVGGIQSRCAIVVEAGAAYVGTCGRTWNARDRDDGVHCLDLASGAQRWFTPTLADVNEIAAAGPELIVPTDSGDVFVIDRGSGEIQAIHRADAAVLGRPVVYRALGGWSAVLASVEGSIYLLDRAASTMAKIGEIGAGLPGGLVALGFDGVLAGGDNGFLYKGRISGGQFLSHPFFELADTGFGARPSIWGAPLVDGSRVYVGYSRDTSYAAPAIACLDHETEQLVWAGAETDEHHGNVRSTPALVDGRLIVAPAYSDAVLILDPETGSIAGRVVLGQNVFQQWSAPVAVGPHHVAVGRVDGVCSIVDVRHQRLLSSVSLATAETERLTRTHRETYGEDTFALYPGEPPPGGAICGTPGFGGGILVVGTTDGSLAAIELNLKHRELLH